MRKPAFTLLELLIAAALTATLATVATASMATASRGYLRAHRSQTVAVQLGVMADQLVRDIQLSSTTPQILPGTMGNGGVANSALILSVPLRDVNGLATGSTEERVYCVEADVAASGAQNLVLYTITPSSAALASPLPASVACTSAGVSTLFQGGAFVVTTKRFAIGDTGVQVASFLVKGVYSQYELANSGAGFRIELAGRYRVENEFSGAVSRVGDTQVDPSQLVVRAIAVRNQRYSGGL